MTAEAAKWFPRWKAAIFGRQGNGIILKTKRPFKKQLLATEYQVDSGKTQPIYVIPQLDGSEDPFTR